MSVNLNYSRLIGGGIFLVMLTTLYIINYSDRGFSIPIKAGPTPSSEPTLFNTLIKVKREQMRKNVGPRSQEWIDQEIVRQLTVQEHVAKMRENATRKPAKKEVKPLFNVREWFDNFSKPLASKMDPWNHPFFNGFLIENPHICEDGPVDILIYVQSHTSNRFQRDIIRQTWGNSKLFIDIVVRTIFILGIARNEEEQISINMENTVSGDIIQGNFTDIFRNLSLKAITSLSWINKNCPQAKTILKVDDDIFVDIFQVVEQFIPLLDKRRMSMICHYQVNAIIIRHPRNKWYIPPQYLPKEEVWPPFCSGYFCLFTGNFIAPLYERSFEPKNYVPTDDTYLFGVLKHDLNDVNITDVGNRITYIATYNATEEVILNGKFGFVAFETPRNAEVVWNLRLQRLSRWERLHSLYAKISESSERKPMIIL